jgi:hypothetical protein
MIPLTKNEALGLGYRFMETYWEDHREGRTPTVHLLVHVAEPIDKLDYRDRLSKHSKVCMTEKGKQMILHLRDREGNKKGGKIASIWMEGRNRGQMTQPHRTAKGKLVKARSADYEVHITEAELAEEADDPAAKNRALRAAIPSLFSFFEGEVFRLYQTFRADQLADWKTDPVDAPECKEKRGIEVKELLRYLCQYASLISGHRIAPPHLRMQALRHILVHPTAIIGGLSAIDVLQLRTSDVKSAAQTLRRFLNSLWNCHARRKGLVKFIKQPNSAEIGTGHAARNTTRIGLNQSGQHKCSEAQIELLKIRQSDYEEFLARAKEAQVRGDHHLRDCFIRAAVESQVAVFDGFISRLYTSAMQNKKRPKKQKQLKQLCKKAGIQLFEYRLDQFRGISTHPMIEMAVSADSVLTKSALDFQRNVPTSEAVEEEEKRINEFCQMITRKLRR